MPSTSSTSKRKRTSRAREDAHRSSRTSPSSGDNRHLCPRCGRPLARSASTGTKAWLLGLGFLRRYRCHRDCAYTTVRFSLGFYRRRAKKLRVALVVVFFFVAAGFTVRYMLARSGAERTTPVDEGIGESD